MREHFQRLARYNRWANRQIYGACAKLSPDDFHAPRAAFFPSIARTLNHIMVGDRIWMGRFVGEPSAHRRLDEVPYQKFAELDAARQAEDDRILAFFNALQQPRIESMFHYKNTAGEPKSAPMDVVLSHFFNHQTHHRGQAHAMLSSTLVPPPTLDLIYYLPHDAEVAHA